MQEKNTTRILKYAACALLAATAISSAPLDTAAVRVRQANDTKIAAVELSNEEYLYSEVSRAVNNGKKKLDLSLKTPVKDFDEFISLCRSAVYKVRRDCPESFLDNHTDFTYYYDSTGYYRVVYSFGYLDISDEQKQAMFAEVDRIVETGKKKTKSEADLLAYFQQVIKDRVTYDTQAAKGNSDSHPNAFHAYGALMEGKAVCQGYAYSFKLLCDKAEIPCWIVTGYYREPHAWNYVMLDGKYYQVDLTWDDTADRSSRSPQFLAGREYAKEYVIEHDSAPGKLAEDSYIETHPEWNRGKKITTEKKA